MAEIHFGFTLSTDIKANETVVLTLPMFRGATFENKALGSGSTVGFSVTWGSDATAYASRISYGRGLSQSEGTRRKP